MLHKAVQPTEYSFLHAGQQAKIHPLPLSVLAREATICVSDFCWHTPVLIAMPRKNPALCDLGAVTPVQVAPAGGTRRKPAIAWFPFGEPLLDCPQ